jgi:uncharacterized protein (DUF1684 family)
MYFVDEQLPSARCHMLPVSLTQAGWFGENTGRFAKIAPELGRLWGSREVLVASAHAKGEFSSVVGRAKIAKVAPSHASFG